MNINQKIRHVFEFKGVEIEYEMGPMINDPETNTFGREILYCSEIDIDKKLERAIHDHYNNMSHTD
jgi:hypothetical protein